MKRKPFIEPSVSLVQNLEDAGCSPDFVGKFLALRESGDVKGQLRLLRIHRESLLDEVHAEQKRIDCLDYLVYHMEKGAAG